ncbi:hypothetical protein HK100_006712, partial [Physocladia obscura]
MDLCKYFAPSMNILTWFSELALNITRLVVSYEEKGFLQNWGKLPPKNALGEELDPETKCDDRPCNIRSIQVHDMSNYVIEKFCIDPNEPR